MPLPAEGPSRLAGALPRLPFARVYGVDFSGARLAGRNTWVAVLEPLAGDVPLRLARLASLEALCGSAERGPALRHLLGMVLRSRRALWALDLPFGLPPELLGPGAGWAQALEFIAGWEGGAEGLGRELCRRSLERVGRMHLRRRTDQEEQAPFDPYHYRVVHQLFHGVREVVLPLSLHRTTAVLPFQHAKLAGAHRVVVEACPASTLRRLGLPRQGYKQTAGREENPARRAVRGEILEGLAPHVSVGERHRRKLLDNRGGDALDALLAAVGAARAWRETDRRAVAEHPRYALEGRLYV